MAPFLTQVRGLLWRNFLIKTRRWKRSVLEVLTPVFLVVLMILINLGLHSQLTPAVDTFPTVNFSFSSFAPTSTPILAAPKQQFTTDVMRDVIRLMNVTSVYEEYDEVTLRGFAEDYRKVPSDGEVGVEFLWKETGSGVSVDGYVLRVPYEMVKDVEPGCFARRYSGRCGRQADGLSTECSGNQALTSGLLSLQWSLETALIRTFKDPGFNPPALQLQMMPVSAYRPGASNVQLLVSLCMVIAMAPLAYYVTLTIVTDRETGAKVMFKVMGIREGVFWLCWFIPYLVTLVLVSVVTTILVALSGFLASSGLAFFFLLVVLYGASLVAFTFLVSVFCSSSQAIFDHEQDTASHVLNGQYPLIAAVFMLLLDTVIYGLLAVYLHVVLPNPYRLPRKPWFCFTPSYWRGRTDDDRENDVLPCDTPEGPHIEPICDEGAHCRVIRIRDLSKKFSCGKREPVYGLNGLDLDIYEGQITCVLGHPGSGKTTLLNILAGVMQPISGVAYIYDLNACSVQDQRELNQTVSYCPQRDVILDDVTVEEHVRMAAFLSGMKLDGLEQEITSCLSDLHLDGERKRKAGELSGCQKRRLSLAVTLLADTKVILLDEPTLGMEREERRHVWDMLHARKDKCVIVVTSRHMEEAHYFADRKVILSTGRLRCVGSSLFLKQHFSVGYLLNVGIKPGSSTDRLLRAVKAHIRGANLTRCEDNKVVISIPPFQAARLTALFKRLESKERGADYLGITDFTLTMNTLEQVFSKMELDDSIHSQHTEEEEAGQVFISPLLSSSDDTFPDDISTGDPRRSSLFPPPLSRSVTSSQLDDMTRRFSLFPASLGGPLGGSDISSRRKSAFPVLEQRPDGVRRPASEERPGGSITRRLSSIFTKSPNLNKSRRGSGDYMSHSQPATPNMRVSRRATLFAEALFKRRSRSPGMLRKNNTSNTLQVMADPHSPIEDSSLNAAGFPTSLAARRATVAAFKDFRRSMSIQSNLSGLGSLNDSPTLPPDPVAKLHLLDTYEKNKASASDASSTRSFFPSESSMDEGLPQDDDVPKDPEKGNAQRPAKIREVLANLKPTKTGLGLEAQRLGAMLRLRVSVCLEARCWLLLRLLLPLLVVGVGVALTHATKDLNPPDPRPAKRIHLFGIEHLVYRNKTGGDITNLESHFSRTLDGTERMTHYNTDTWDSGLPLESLLDVQQADGNSYKLFYNSSCALALPHLTSFLAHVMRDSPTPTPTNPNNSAFLGPRLSAWLQPWQPREPVQGHRTWDWIPICFLGLALLLTPSTFGVRLLLERETKIRSYLGVMGVKRLMYYAPCVIVDIIELMIPAACIVLICGLSEMEMFEEEGAVETMALLMLLSVPVHVLFSYTTSFFFSHHHTCRLLAMPLTVLITVSQWSLVHFLDIGDTEHTAVVLHYVFTVIWPPYIPFGGFNFISKTGDRGEVEVPPSEFFQFQSHVDICYIMALVDIGTLSFMVMFLDKLTFRPPSLPCCKSSKKKSFLVNHPQNGDEGVTSELERVKNLQKNTDKTRWPWLVVNAISKVFTVAGVRSERSVKAVNNTTLTVNTGQVLALLGPREAGKTTLIESVLGLNHATSGSSWMEGKECSRGLWNAGSSRLGYCPQHDPLWPCLTVDQHVQLIARVTGLRRHDVDIFRDSLYHDLDLEAYRFQKVAQLSVCEKRKLSFAMSMLGHQSAVILDEPSSGMDPRSRRMYWDAVKHFLENSERSAVISTHNVEEARMLASQLAVFINGELRCFGTAEELESRCSETYTLEVVLRGWEEGAGGQKRMDMLVLFLSELFPGLQVRHQFRQRAVFTVTCPAATFSWAATFDTLESLKRNLNVEDFTFSQCSLDHTYLELAKQQKEGDSKYITTPHEPHNPAPNHTPTQHTNPKSVSTDTPVGVANSDPASQPRDVEDEGGASCEGAGNNADAAACMIVIHHCGDDDGGGVAGVDEGGASEGGAAAPVVFSLNGVDNLAFNTDSEDALESQTTL